MSAYKKTSNCVNFGMTTTYSSSSDLCGLSGSISYCSGMDTLFVDDNSIFCNCSPYSLRSCFITNSDGLTQRSNVITDQVLKRTVSNLSSATKSESDITPRTPCKQHFDRLHSQSLDVATMQSDFLDTVSTTMDEEDDDVSNNYSIHYNRKVRMCLVGDEACGKTSIISQYVQKSFPNFHDPTIQESYSKIVRKTELETFELYITDTSGSDQYADLKDSYIRESLVFVFVFDVTNESSFEKMKQLVAEVQEKKFQLSKIEHFPIIIIANKIDMMCSRVVSKKQVRQAMREMKLKHNLSSYIEVSAKQRYHVDKVFKKVLMLTDSWNCIYNLQQEGTDFGFVTTPRKVKSGTPSSTSTPRSESLCSNTDSLFYYRNNETSSDTESDITDCSEGEEESLASSEHKAFLTRKRSKTTTSDASNKRSIFSRKTNIKARVCGNSAPELNAKQKVTIPDVHSASDLSVTVGGSSNRAIGLKKGISLSSSLFQLALGNRFKFSKEK